MKAQFWSFDAIFAMVIFSAALIILSFVWLNVSNQYSISSGLGTQNMQLQLQSLQSRIVTAGVPSDWNSQVNVLNLSTWNNVSIGLGTGTGSQLSINKIATLSAMASYNSITYHSTKSLLGIGYDYYIIINSTNRTYTIGMNPNYNRAYAIQVARQSAVLNGVPVRMQIMVWTNKSFGVV